MKHPAHFPIRWKGDDSVLISSKEAYPADKMYLVCCSYPVIDQQCFDADCREVKKMLGLLDKDVVITTAVYQIRELQKAAAEKGISEHQRSMDQFVRVYHEVFSFLNGAVNRLNSEEKSVLSQLANTECVLVGKTSLMMPSKCAMTETHRGLSLLPYLAVIPQDTASRHGQVLKALGVKDSFTLSDYIWILHEVQARSQGRTLDADEMQLVIFVINQCIDAECRRPPLKTTALENLPVPSAADRLCPASSLCYNNCPWLITPDDVNCCNQNITYPATESIGIKTIRKDIMKRHKLALPFGQKERLVKRIKRIVESYPFNEDILKEMVQNADDAGATIVHFISDTRSLKTEKVFDDSWKSIQGPALCVYNDRSFTDEDLQGIQRLGEGSKSDDPVKTGRYGVGFNCVYHLTDVPTFFTTVGDQGTFLCAFDPNCKYVPDADSHDPGGMFQVTDDMQTNFCDVFSGYFTDHYDISKVGTVFRLPLRTKDMARESEILQSSVNEEDVGKLFDRFRNDMYEALLFVNSVEKICLRKVMAGSGETTQLEDLYSVQVRLSDDAKRQRSLLQSKMQKAARKKEKKLAMIETTEVVYELTTEDSNKKQDVWLIVQRFGFEDSFQIPKSVSDAYQCGDLGLLPIGGIAYLKQTSTRSTDATAKSKRLFCFLPLPVQLSELPVHVNGHFVLSNESRRGLWTDEHKSFKSEWNRCIMEGVVAPAYCTLIRKLKESLIGHDSDSSSFDEAKAKLEKFHSVFPKVSKTPVPYETSLTTSVYRYIGNENLDVLPLLSPTKQLQNVKWMGPLGQPNKKVYFDDLQSQMDSTECAGQTPRTFFRSSGPVGIQTHANDQRQASAHVLIRLALIRCGFLLFACPLRLCDNFEKAGVPVQRINPHSVLDFFASHNQRITQCKLGTLPSKLSESPLKDINFVEALLKYCCKVPDFKQRFQNMPLLVTESLMLTTFDSQDRKYVTEYSDVAPHAPGMFVHSVVSKALQLQPVEDVHLCKEFDVAEYSKLLPDMLDVDDYCGAYKTVNMSKMTELLRQNKYTSRWLARTWSFFASFVPQRQSTSTVQPEIILMPVMDWCLLPVSCGDCEMLVPVSQSPAVFNLVDETPTDEFIDILRTLEVAEVSWKYIDVDVTSHQSYFMKSLLGNVHQPQCIVSVLKNVLQRRTLEGALSVDKGLRLLAYFSDNIAGLNSDDDTKNVISQLPFFMSKNNSQISINRAASYVLPTVPGDDMDIWREQLNVTFLEQEPKLEKLVKYLGCKCLTVVEAYTDFIFPHFDKLSPAGQKIHIEFVRVYLHQLKAISSKATESDKSALIKKLKSLAFLPSHQRDGSTVPASAYYDVHHEVFKAVLPENMFPPSPYCDLMWREFLLDCGIIHEVTQEMFVEFATKVEKQAAERVEDAVCQQSKILLKHFLQRNDIQSSSFIDKIKGICFIEPERVLERFEHLHPQHGIRDATGRLQFVQLQHSVLSGNKEVTWTTKNILPACVSEDMLTREKNRHRKFVDLMQELQVIVEPSSEEVAEHVKQLCTYVIASCDLHVETVSVPLQYALNCIYSFLIQRDLQPNAISVLSEVPIIYVTDSCQLIRPMQFATDILEEQEIKPHLNKFPLALGPFVDMFLKLGTTRTPTVYQYAAVIEAIHGKAEERQLLPDESQATSRALKGMFELMLRDKQAQLPVPACIYFPSRSRKLLKSSEIVYVDDERLLRRLKQFQKPLLVDLKPICGEINEEDVQKVLQKLPVAQQPSFLSSIVKDCLDEGCADTDSDVANELRNRLGSAEFRNGVQRIARHCLASKSLTQEITKMTIQQICTQVQTIRVVGKSEIKTYLEYEGERIANSEESLSFFHDIIRDDDGNTIPRISVQRIRGYLGRLHSHVANVINKTAGNRLLPCLDALTLIVGCQLQEIDEVLTERGVKKLSEVITQFSPPIGSFVPENKYCFLVHNVFFFEIGWLVALEVDDPFDRGECGRAKYKLVEVMERLRSHGESAMADRYRVKVSTDGEEQILDSTLLYAFSRDAVPRNVLDRDDDDEEDNCDSAIVLRPPGSADGPAPEIPLDFPEIVAELKRQLKEAWALPEEQRRRIIKRLKLQWHPDKHPEEKKSLMTKVFQLLQNLVALLEQGRPIDDVDEADVCHAAGNTNAYDDFMRERARSYRQQHDHYRYRRHNDWHFRQHRNAHYRDEYADFFNFQPPPSPPQPQPAEAERWMRQANYDLEAANSDDAPEWSCYKCYQVIMHASKIQNSVAYAHWRDT